MFNIFVRISILIVLTITELSAQESDSIKSFTLSEVTVVANRLKSNPSDLHTKVEIIDFEKIRNTNGFTLSEKLKISPTTFIKSYGHSASLQSISFNGLGAEHTVVLINGVKINSFQNSMVDLSLIPSENIERIEIINNGTSAVYGSEAISGVINLVTKNKFSYSELNPLSVNASLSIGSFNTNRFNLNLSKNFGVINASAFFSKEKSDGNYEYLFDNGLEKIKKQRKNSSFNNYNIGLNAQLFITPSNYIQIYSDYIDSFKEIPGIETGTPPTESNQRDRNWNNIISYDGIISNSLSLKTSFNFQNNLMNYYLKPFVKSYYKNNVYSFSNDLTYNNSFISSLIGYNFTYAQLKSNEVEDGAKRNQHSIYLSSNTNFSEIIKIYPSIRFDYLSDIKKDVITYQVGFNFQPFQNIGFKIRGNFGKNFRAPTFNDLYWKQMGNVELSPEYSNNKEFGFIYEQLKSFGYKFELTYTDILAKDKIIWLPTRNFLWQPINISSSKSNSLLFNFSLTGLSINRITINYDLGVNYVHSIKTSENYPADPTKNKFFPYLPKVSIKSGIYFGFELLKLNLFYTHNGKRFSDFENLKPMNPINLLDGNIIFTSKILDLNTEIKFEINNITDNDYQIILGYPMPLRNYKITISFTY